MYPNHRVSPLCNTYMFLIVHLILQLISSYTDIIGPLSDSYKHVYLSKEVSFPRAPRYFERHFIEF